MTQSGHVDQAGFDPAQIQPPPDHLALRYFSVRPWGANMRRRDFLSAGVAVLALPSAVQAQQPEQMRRIGVLMNLAPEDADGQARFVAFIQELAQLGWSVGRNAQIDVRWVGGQADRYRSYAADLVSLSPDILLGTNASSVRALRQATRTIPIVFAGVSDPIGAGLVDTLARPSGNTTGFMIFEYEMAGKWLQLLKEVAPFVTRAGIIRDSAVVAAIGQFGAIQAMAPSLGIELRAIEADDIERGIPAFARQPNGGLIVLTGASAQTHRDKIVMLATRHKLPAVYWQRLFAAMGGLISYGPDVIDQSRQAARYVDRILKGEKPADLPVQAPTKYELVVNLKTAKTIGLSIPTSVLARADGVIE
jgi:putative tryptophan/tyrosine transport system substrate-binding protein